MIVGQLAPVLAGIKLRSFRKNFRLNGTTRADEVSVGHHLVDLGLSMPMTPGTVGYCDEPNVLLGLDLLPPEHVQLVVDVLDRCCLDDPERMEEETFLAPLLRRMAQDDKVAGSDFVRRLIALRNSDRLSELEAAILIERTKRLGRNVSLQGGAYALDLCK